MSTSLSEPPLTFFAERFFAAGAAKITTGQALKSRDKDLWIQCIHAEITQLINGGTLVAVDDCDIIRGSKIIHSTLQLKVKLYASGLLDKYKARLCACGNELAGLVDDTFSPTVGALAYSTVLQIAIIDAMKMMTVDTVGAYLHQVYPDDAPPLYMVLSDNVSLACNLPVGQKYRIKKYLYGLPDAGRAYFKAYSSHLKSKGYSQTTSDPCLFTKRSASGAVLYAFFHVDDTFVSSTDPAMLSAFLSDVGDKFKITHSDDIQTYLGIQFARQPNGDFVLSQPKLLNSLLDEYSDRLTAHKIRGVPSPQRSVASQSKDTTPMDQSAYLHLQGALIYLTKSRPDIMTAVSFGAVFSAKPTQGAFTELIHCLKYLQMTQTKGLRLIAGVPSRPLVLKCYVDAGYLTHADSKSQQGYCLSFGDHGIFYAKSSKQQLVATSSTHSEMRALYSLICDVIYVVHLSSELYRPIVLPAVLFEDNSAVLSLSLEMTTRVKRCKHFLMLVNFVRQEVEAGLVLITKVPTEDNNADLLTKILIGSDFVNKASRLLGEVSSSN